MMLLCSWLHDFAFFRRFLLIWWSTFHGHSSNLVWCRMFAPTQHCAASPCPAWSSRRGAAVLFFLPKYEVSWISTKFFFEQHLGEWKVQSSVLQKSTNFPRFFYRKPVGEGVGRWLSLLYFQDERGCHWCGGRCYEFHLRIFGWLWLQNPSLKFDLIRKTANHGICTYYVFMSFIMKIIKVIQL